MIDITSLPIRELRNLLTQIKTTIHRRERDEKKRLLTKMRAIARESGVDLLSVLTHKAPAPVKRRRRAAAATPLPHLYFSPLNPNEGWCGRGRKPRWAQNWIDNGGDLDDLKRKR